MHEAVENNRPLYERCTAIARLLGLNPNPLYDTRWYLKQNPDILTAGICHPKHDADHGERKEGANSHFNCALYM